MTRTPSALFRVLAPLAACLLLLGPAANVASAQSGTPGAPTEEPLRPPTAGKPDNPPVVLYWLTLGVTVLLVVGVNLMPSKRGHQD